MATAHDQTKDARLEFRVPSDLKALIEDAASLQGVTVSDFLAATAYREATRTLQERAAIKLNREETTRFVEAMLNPPEPTEALRNLMRRTDDRQVR